MNHLETLFIPEEIKNKELSGKLIVVMDVMALFPFFLLIRLRKKRSNLKKKGYY